MSETQSRSTADAVELFLPTHVVPLRSAQRGRDLAAGGAATTFGKTLLKARCCPRTFKIMQHVVRARTGASEPSIPACTCGA